eukprot:7272159-Prorocentrum_lima.AAC.1
MAFDGCEKVVATTTMLLWQRFLHTHQMPCSRQAPTPSPRHHPPSAPPHARHPHPHPQTP